MNEHDETESHVSSDSDEGGSSSLAELAEELVADTSATGRSHDVTTTGHDAEASDSSRRASLSDLADAVRGKRSGITESREREGAATGWQFTDVDTDPVDTAVELGSESVAVLDSVEDEANVLLVGPTDSSAAYTLCERVLEPHPPETKLHQLLVSVDTPPNVQRDILQSIRRGSVESQVLVDAQSYAASDVVGDYDDSVTVLDVATPRDLRRIGILMTKTLTEWADTDGSSRVCLHTLSDLLDAADDVERVFRFVHILHGRIRASDAHAYFYLDPTRHDEQTIRTFFSLFDTIVEFDADGSLRLL